MIQRTLLYVGFALLASTAQAVDTGLSYEGQILKPGGAPLEGQTTQFKFQIRTPDVNNCLMYEEVQTLDMRGSGGSFSLTINDGSGTRTDSTGLSLNRIFANQGSFNFIVGSCLGGSGTSYNPVAGDSRKLVVFFKDESMGSWEEIPAENINYAPFAVESKQIAGFGADSLLRVVNGSGDPVAGLAPLSNAQYSALMDLVNGTSTAFTKAGQLNGVALPSMAAGEVLGWNGTQWVAQAPSAPGPNSIMTTMIQNNAVDASKIASGAVDGTKLDPAISISTSGTVSSAIAMTRDFKMYAPSPSTYYVGMLADPTLSASYTLTWPLSQGSYGQVLTSDGSGKMVWMFPITTPTGPAGGDLSGSYPNPIVAAVGGSTASNIHSAEILANAATTTNTSNTIVKRDGLGSFAANVGTFNGVVLNNAGSLVNILNPSGSAYTLMLPNNTGTNGQVLMTNGSGATSWATPLSSTTAFVQGGNSFGVNADLGTNDNYDLNLKTNGLARLTIAKNGNVGIGTSNPSSNLDVYGSLNASGGISSGYMSIANSQMQPYAASGSFPLPDGGVSVDIQNNGTVNQSASYLKLYAKNSSSITQGAYIGAFSGAGYAPTLVFGSQTGATAYAERMRIDPSGNVGIGTTSPNAPLHIKTSASRSLVLENTGGGGSVVDMIAGPYTSRILNSNSSPLIAFRPDAYGSNTMVTTVDGTSFGNSMTPAATMGLRGTIDVTAGAIVGAPAYNASGLILDFAFSNTIVTTTACGSTWSLYNLKDGATYKLIVNAASAGTCTFNAYSNAGSTSLTLKKATSTLSNTLSVPTMFEITVVGTLALVRQTDFNY